VEILKNLKQHRFFIQCLSILISALIACSVFPVNIINVNAEKPAIWDGTAATDFAGGNGTETTPFLIENANQLYKMLVEYHTYAASYGKYFKITKDIYLNDVVDGTSVKDLTDKKNWLADYGNTIATASKANSFNGNLDGGNNTIYGLYVDGIKSAGLFPAISSYAVIENLSFENLYITDGNGFGGAIAGQAIYYHWNSAAKITNCSVVDATIGESSNIEFVGGFIGDIKECSVYFTNCYTYDISLSDKATAGGIVGYAYSGGTLKMTNCYSIGHFPTRSNNSKAVCANVYTDTAAPTGNTTANVTVLTSEQMKGENAKQNMSGFDFDRAWKTVENGYPVHFVYIRPSHIWDGSKAETFAGGTGTESDPFLISNGAQLYKMVAEYSNGATTSGADNTPAYFKLTSDIYLNDVKSGDLENPTVDAWNGLGFENWYVPANGNSGFCGVIDGGGHTVYGLYSNGAYAGLIPLATDGAKIYNLNLKNSYTNGTNTAGGIIGYVPGHYSLDFISVSGCMVDNVVIYGKEYRAGAMVGGIGYIKIKVSDCSTTNSKITAASTTYPGRASGMLGYAVDNNVKHEVTNCFTDASVHPVCIATDKANFDRIDDKVNYTNVYTSATKNFDADEGVTYLTPEQMQGENAKQNLAGFDFDRAWKTVEGGYPVHYVYVKPDHIWDGTKADKFAGGSGKENDPYLIENGAQLYKMVVDYSNASTAKGAENKKVYFKLTKDIYLNDVLESDLQNPSVETWSSVFTPWYSVANKETGFCGDFDGDGHTVYGLYCNNTRFSGLVSMLTEGGNIHNLNLKNSYIRGYESAGGIVGYVYGHYTLSPATVSYCSVDNAVIEGTAKQIGGIVGGCNDIGLTVTDCSVTKSKITSANADNPNLASGIIGYGWGGTKKAINCFTDDSVNPVTATTDKASFDVIDNFVDYTKVYTCATKNFDAEGVTYLSKEQMQGENAKRYMNGFNFVAVWSTVKDGYPVLSLDSDNIWDGTKADKFAGGKGTSEDPYLIENGGQLYKMVSEYSNTPVNAKPESHTYFKITKDIYLNNKQWYTVNSTAYPNNENYKKGFSGIINGEGHTIYGLYNNLASASVGLIPVATQGAEIHDLHLESGYFPKAEWNVYVGAAFIGSAIGVSNSAPIVIKGCSVRDFTVESRDASAAFVGYIYSQSVGIYNSYCIDSNISHTNTTDTKINSSAFVAVTNGNDYLNSITVANSYCVDVSPLIYLSGNFAAITKYSNIYTNFAEYDNSVNGIKKLTSEQMKGENAKEYMTGLDFGTFWKTVEDGYPVHSLYVKPDYVWDGSKASKFAGGTGTATDPYLIKTGAQLYKMVSEYSNASGASGSANKGSYFKLANDIYLNDVKSGDMENPNETSWSSKFNSWYKVTSYSKGFCGELDGDGYTVYGLYSNGGYSGLIPVLMDGGSVHNLNIKNSYIRGTESGGGIVGFVKAHWKMAPVSVSYCTVDNVVIESTKKFVGGIIGGFGDIKITVSDCSVTRSKLKSTNENPNLVSGIIGNGWGDSLVQKVTNCFTDSSVHPVTATTDKASFDTIAAKVSYKNVYTSAKKNFAVDGVTYLDSDSKLKGTSAEKTLKGFNFKNDWSATKNDYPVIKKGAGEWLYDNSRPGETWSGKLARYYASGEGTKDNPYIIKTGGQLALLANDALNGKTVGKYYRITDNIILNDTSSENWKETANEWYTGSWARAFRGYLDGGYHTVSGLYLNKTKETYTGTDYYGGLFACIGKGAVIEKLGIVNSSLTFTDPASTKYLGAFAGFVDQYDSSAKKASYEEYPIIRECFADTTVVLDGGSCGGFIGCATRPIRVEDSFFTGTVKSTGRGLFGYSKMGYTVEDVLVKNFYAADSMYAVISNASYDNIKCENCYSSSAQDKEGLTRLFIDRMFGKAAKENMTGFDFEKIWTVRGDNETPGLKGFDAKVYSNAMSPEDIVISFETNCDLQVESITGKAYSKLTLPVLEREGYIFEGWYSFPELDVPFDYDYFPTFNTILYAKWTLSGFIQDFEQYADSVYDYHEGYEYYRPTTPNYSADYVHGGGKSMHRVGGSDEALDFLLFYEDELEVGKIYKMSYYVTTDQEKASVDMSLVHLDWPDVYCENKGVNTLSKLDNLKDGEWQECTYTFVAKSKWIAIRTSGKDSVYFDDFILYTTDEAANVGADISNDFNSLWIVIAVAAVAVVILGAGITFFIIKKRAKQK